MKTYIRRNISGYYIEFPEEIDAQYWEGKIGTTYEDFLMDKWIELSDEQLAFHNNHLNASIKEVLEMQITPVAPHVRTLEEAKEEKISQIKEYDSSDEVNSFNVIINDNTITTWITPDKRADYALSIESAKKLQMTEVTPVLNGIPVTISVEMADMALAQIQIYANRCYNVTETHKAAVEALESIEDVDVYDYQINYPEKLTFNL